MDYERKRHSVYRLTYHLIFVTKYRRPVITDEIGDFMKNHAAYLCGRFGGELVSAETDADHIHLLVSLPPDVRLSDVVCSMKTQLSKEIHNNPAFMEHVSKYLYGPNCPLWSPSYFAATTGSVSLETVKAYIESQRTDEHRVKRGCLREN